jgi:diguanylate cyclase (GGDEF)-like protein
MKEIIVKESKILKAIFGIINSIGPELELDKVCDLTVNKISKVINCNGCAIFLIGDDNSIKMQSEIGFGKSIREIKFNAGMPLIKYILKTKKKLLIDDIKNSYFKHDVPMGNLMTSMISVPILVKNNVKGIIYIDSKKTKAFSYTHEYFLDILAHVISNAIERSLNYEKIKKLTVTDELTGVFNRRKFDFDLKDEISKATRYIRNLSLLMIDIDWFKKYNDFYGHQMGDKILEKIGELFNKNKRLTDKVYRYGGEEFAVICSETSKEDAVVFAERLRKVIDSEDFEGQGKIQPKSNLTISIGVSNFPFDAFNLSDLVKHADEALYRAKAEGRNKVVV